MLSPRRDLERRILYSKDIEIYTGRSARTARRFMRIARRKLGKDQRDMVSIKEFCQLFKFDEEEFRSSLRMPLLFFAFVLLELIIFRDDLDTLLRFLLAVLCLKIQFPGFNRFLNKLRCILFYPDAIKRVR